MSDYLARLANCTLSGIEFTEGTKDGRPWRFRNLIRLNVEGFELELHQDTSLPPNRSKLKGHWVHTTDLYVRNVDSHNLQQLNVVIDNVCDLLSFATESRVLPYGYEYPAGSGLGGTTSTVGTVQTGRSPFAEPEQAKQLVETCYGSYVALRHRRRLHVTIDYIHHSVKAGLAREVQIGLACICFESLRHNWALDTGYQHIDGFFREKAATTARPGNPVGLKRHIAEMFTEVRMSSDPERIVKIRNEVLHTGLYGDVQNDDTYEFLETTLREYFLRVVEYRGHFMPYKGGSPAPQIIA